ncbi:MAG: hypothetical protein HXY45_17520 [Syntrophaceae bacterium]|jgi:hypothetical protein|nr:hypothetical protein [Syntrophaceae bacterium]
MINLEGKTKLNPEETLKRLKKYFGKGGQGLEVAEEGVSCISFSGGGGYVNATVCPEAGKTRVNLVAKEWEYQAKEFLSQLP